MDLIDRQAVLDGKMVAVISGQAINVVPVSYIKTLPYAQPEHGTGTWIIDDEYPQHCWCSECNHRFDLFDPKSIHFCPNCGSEMKTCVWKSQYEKEI